MYLKFMPITYFPSSSFSSQLSVNFVDAFCAILRPSFLIVLCLLNYDGQQLLRKRQEALYYSCIFLKINKMIVVYTHCFYTVCSFLLCQNVSSLIQKTDLLHTNKFIRVFQQCMILHSAQPSPLHLFSIIVWYGYLSHEAVLIIFFRIRLQHFIVSLVCRL